MLPGEGRGPPPGRGPGRGWGRGIGRSAGCWVEKGLLPTRGVRGAGFGAGPGRGPGVAPGVGRGPGVAPGVGAVGALAAAEAAGALGAAGCGAAGLGADGFAGAAGVSAAGAAGAGAAGLGAEGFAAVAGLGAGAPEGLGAAGAGAPLPPWLRGFSSALLAPDLAPKVSRSRRATGASTVEDADFTNSPCSLSVARSSLLVTPSSFANSCTRALPATTSPHLEATAVVGAAPRFSYDAWSSGLHGVLMFFATCSLSRGGRALRDSHRGSRHTRSPQTYPVNRRFATLVRRPAAGLPVLRTSDRGATRHPARACLPWCRPKRCSCRSRRSPRLYEASRRPTLASGSRYMSAPVRQGCRGCVDASKPESRAGSRLSLPSHAL